MSSNSNPMTSTHISRVIRIIPIPQTESNFSYFPNPPFRPTKGSKSSLISTDKQTSAHNIGPIPTISSDPSSWHGTAPSPKAGRSLNYASDNELETISRPFITSHQQQRSSKQHLSSAIQQHRNARFMIFNIITMTTTNECDLLVLLRPLSDDQPTDRPTFRISLQNISLGLLVHRIFRNLNMFSASC